jgi:hypothetical protein
MKATVRARMTDRIAIIINRIRANLGPLGLLRYEDE